MVERDPIVATLLENALRRLELVASLEESKMMMDGGVGVGGLSVGDGDEDCGGTGKELVDRLTLYCGDGATLFTSHNGGGGSNVCVVGD